MANTLSLRIAIQCAYCHRRNHLVRTLTQPGPVYIVCHGCERRLTATIHPGPQWKQARDLAMSFAGD